MVMTCRHAPYTSRLILLVLLSITPQLASAAPTRGEGWEGGAERNEDRLGPFLSLPPLRSGPPGPPEPPGPADQPPDQGRGGDSPPDMQTDPAKVLGLLLEALEQPGEEGALQQTGQGEQGEGEQGEGAQAEEQIPAESSEGGVVRRTGETAVEKGRELMIGYLTAAMDSGFTAMQGEQGSKWTGQAEGERVPAAEGGEGEREGGDAAAVSKRALAQVDDLSLQRKIRGYFQNIDLGLQDNEILPPLKGYKAYNTQLARAGKKLHWKEEQARNRPSQGGNFMDDFENDGGGEELEEIEEEDESLTRLKEEEEETRARAEKQEVLRQQEEAERAREEEQRLADIASDMLLQYMGRKQQQPYIKPRQKSGMFAASNTAEDKRSEEVGVGDDDDLDQQMIDRLIEISSKLHLPADDVVEIISDVEEKKKKRKELQQQPAILNAAMPRFRPLVPPPLASPPIYHYTASTNPKKAPYVYKSNQRWHKDNVKSYKQDYWYKPQKQIDYWYKPQKQFLAFPSYPYYQKPYRAYYPVYFPYPKQRHYGKPSPSRDQPFGPQDLDLQVPRRRFRAGGKGRGQSWRQQQQPPPRLPLTPYISNYILPHPRTYQPLPPPKPISPGRRGRRPPYYYPHATPGDDYEEDGLVPQLDSEEELENFIERIYMKRRMY